jgi:hypothetical protein
MTNKIRDENEAKQRVEMLHRFRTGVVFTGHEEIIAAEPPPPSPCDSRRLRQAASLRVVILQSTVTVL